MRVAYNQSRARAQYALEGDILLRYVAILDHRTRDSHKKMHGTLLSRWHNFWKLNYPPNGWNCRCRVNAYTRAEAKAKGWEETEDEFLPQGGIADKDWRYDTRNLTGEWAELDRVYLNKANRIIQGAHPSIKDHIQKGLREIEEERRVKRELWTAFDEMKAAKDNKKRTRELTRLPPVDIIDLSDDLKKRLSLSLDREVSITAERIWLSRETIASHFHHGEIEAIDYFMVRFYKGAYYAEPDPTESSEPNPRHAVYYYKEGYFYRAVFKVTRDGKEVYLVSLVKSDSGKKFKLDKYHEAEKEKERRRGARRFTPKK